MSEPWEPRSLSSLAKYINGFAFKPDHWGDEGLPIVRIEQLNNPDGNYDFCSIAVPFDNLIDDGDLVFSWSATLKVAFWQRGKAALNQHLFKVVPEPDVDQEFLFQLLDYHMEALAGGAHGSTMKHIKRSELDRFVVEIPEKNVQTLLADILGSLDNQIGATEALIAKQERLRAGLMQDLFTRGVDENGELRPPREEAPHLYKETELGWLPKGWSAQTIQESPIEIEDGDRGHNYPSAEDLLSSGDCLFLSAKNVTKSGFAFNDCQFISVERDQLLRNGKLLLGDVVVTTRGTVGQMAIFDHNVPFSDIRINSGMFILRSDPDQIGSKYLFEALRQFWFAKQLSSRGSGSAQPQLPIKDFKKFRLPRPSLTEQKSLVTLVDGFREMQNREKSQLNKLKVKKTGLMQDLLTGTVSVEPLLEKEPA